MNLHLSVFTCQRLLSITLTCLLWFRSGKSRLSPLRLHDPQSVNLYLSASATSIPYLCVLDRLRWVSEDFRPSSWRYLSTLHCTLSVIPVCHAHLSFLPVHVPGNRISPTPFITSAATFTWFFYTCFVMVVVFTHTSFFFFVGMSVFCLHFVFLLLCLFLFTLYFSFCHYVFLFILSSCYLYLIFLLPLCLFSLLTLLCYLLSRLFVTDSFFFLLLPCFFLFTFLCFLLSCLFLLFTLCFSFVIMSSFYLHCYHVCFYLPLLFLLI